MVRLELAEFFQFCNRETDEYEENFHVFFDLGETQKCVFINQGMNFVMDDESLAEHCKSMERLDIPAHEVTVRCDEDSFFEVLTGSKTVEAANQAGVLKISVSDEDYKTSGLLERGLRLTLGDFLDQKNSDSEGEGFDLRSLIRESRNEMLVGCTALLDVKVPAEYRNDVVESALGSPSAETSPKLLTDQIFKAIYRREGLANFFRISGGQYWVADLLEAGNAAMVLTYAGLIIKILGTKQKEVQEQLLADKAVLIRKFNEATASDDWGDVDESAWRSVANEYLQRRFDLDFSEQIAALRIFAGFLGRVVNSAMGASAPDESSVSTGVDYEHHLVHLLKSAGFNASVTKASGDQGADVVVESPNGQIVIQAKYYSKPVGNGAVQEVSAARGHYGAAAALVVTNASL